MINKTYNISEIFLSKEEIDRAVREYIENYNNPRISYPKNYIHEYNMQDNKLQGITVKLVFKNSEEIPNGSITESSEEEQSMDQDSEVSKSKKKKSSKPLFSRGGLLSEKVRIKF